MPPATSPLWKFWLVLSRVCVVVAQDAGDDARSLSVALQNINGMSSVFSLLPVLTGKTQNVKAVAARTFPGSLSVAGLGAGRVLSKMQIGIMLFSADLYRNLVGDLSYYHQEYVNVFSPPLIHIPTGTPERHSSNIIINHNPTEDYMIEAWFQTQGLPAKVELKQNNNRRMFCGSLAYLAMYAAETFLCVKNAATGTGLALILMQIVSGLCWTVAICVLQITRGQGKRFINLNRLSTAEYRCYQLIISGKHVQSAQLSTQLSNIRDYNLFDSKYERKRLKALGGAMIASGMIDIFATVLIVGLNEWAYGWLGMQVLLIIVKVIFSLEPIRRIPIVKVLPLVEAQQQGPNSLPALASEASRKKTQLPIIVSSAPEFSFTEVRTTHNVVVQTATNVQWHSRSPGLFIGQPYYAQRSTPTATVTEKKHTERTVKARTTCVVTPVSEKRMSSTETASLPTPTGTASTPTSPTASEYSSSLVTVVPSPQSPGSTDCPRTCLESPVLLSPVSPVAPPGIPLARSMSESNRIEGHAPSPPSQPLHSATLPARQTVNDTLPAPPKDVPLSLRPTPLRSQTLVAPNLSPTDEYIDITPKPESQSAVPSATTEVVRYLALHDDRLVLSPAEPAREGNQALQREFLACLAEVVKANKVPSAEFLVAVETMSEGIRQTMSGNWYTFGTTDLVRYLRTSYQDLMWRRFV